MPSLFFFVLSSELDTLSDLTYINFIKIYVEFIMSLNISVITDMSELVRINGRGTFNHNYSLLY